MHALHVHIVRYPRGCTASGMLWHELPSSVRLKAVHDCSSLGAHQSRHTHMRSAACCKSAAINAMAGGTPPFGHDPASNLTLCTCILCEIQAPCHNYPDSSFCDKAGLVTAGLCCRWLERGLEVAAINLVPQVIGARGHKRQPLSAKYIVAFSMVFNLFELITVIWYNLKCHLMMASSLAMTTC